MEKRRKHRRLVKVVAEKIAFLCLLIPSIARAEEPIVVSWVGFQGGTEYANAEPLPAGRTLRLNHYQFPGRSDYFWIDLKPAQTLTLSLAAGSRGIEVRSDGTFVETDRPYAGLQVRDAEATLLGELEVAGEKNVQKSLEIDVADPQRFYVLVGSARQGTHKDQFVFRADVRNNFDGDGGRDAGSSPQAAVSLPAPRDYPENHLTTNDAADYFRFPAVPGRKVRLHVVPENPKTRLLASLYNEVFQEIGRGRSPDPGAAVRLEAEASSPTLYLRIYRDVGNEPTRYAIVFPEDLPPLVKAPIVPIYRPKFLSND